MAQEVKHTPPTPGPWSVVDNSWEVSSVYGPDGDLVAECQINSDVDEDTQEKYEAIKEANARLVGAAWEMLEASKSVLAAWQRLAEALPQDDRIEAIEFEEFNALRSAVSKAVGIEPWEVHKLVAEHAEGK